MYLNNSTEIGPHWRALAYWHNRWKARTYKSFSSYLHFSISCARSFFIIIRQICVFIRFFVTLLKQGNLTNFLWCVLQWPFTFLNSVISHMMGFKMSKKDYHPFKIIEYVNLSIIYRENWFNYPVVLSLIVKILSFLFSISFSFRA